MTNTMTMNDVIDMINDKLYEIENCMEYNENKRKEIEADFKDRLSENEGGAYTVQYCKQFLEDYEGLEATYDEWYASWCDLINLKRQIER